MYTISYILVVIITLIFIYTGIYGCGCMKKESFDLDYKTDTKTMNELKKIFNSNLA
jgi:hypothetical protein